MSATLYLGNSQSGHLLEGFAGEFINENDGNDPRPTGHQFCTGLQCEARLTDEPEIASWANDPSGANRRDGRIEFGRNGVVFKVLRFWDAYLEGYSVTAASNLRPRQVFVINPRQVSMDSEQPEISYAWDAVQ